MIPIIDISPLVSLDCNDCKRGSKVATPELDNVIKAIRDACTTVGFFAITNHGVDTATINNAWKSSQEFFDSDAISIKQSVPMTEDYPYGYENIEMLGIERNKESATSDSKETFSIGPADAVKSNMPPRKFPSSSGSSSSSSGFEVALTNYY